MSMDLNEVPGLAPPPGVTPNFHSPMTGPQRMVLILSVALFTLSTFTLCLRMYTRICIVKTAALDDCIEEFPVWHLDALTRAQMLFSPHGCEMNYLIFVKQS